MAAAKQVEVDRSVCLGMGICESLDPDRFEVGDDGTLVLHSTEVADGDLEDVEDAVASCPTGALRLR